MNREQYHAMRRERYRLRRIAQTEPNVPGDLRVQAMEKLFALNARFPRAENKIECGYIIAFNRRRSMLFVELMFDQFLVEHDIGYLNFGRIQRFRNVLKPISIERRKLP